MDRIKCMVVGQNQMYGGTNTRKYLTAYLN